MGLWKPWISRRPKDKETGEPVRKKIPLAVSGFLVVAGSRLLCSLCIPKMEQCISSHIYHVNKLHHFLGYVDGGVIIQLKSDVDQLRARARLVESNQGDCVAESSLWFNSRGVS